MTRKDDERLQHQLEQKLISHGMRPPCQLHVTVRDGVVTLTGTVQHDYQKRAAVHACRTQTGVRSVINQITAPGFHNVWINQKEWQPQKSPSDTAPPKGGDQPPAEKTDPH